MIVESQFHEGWFYDSDLAEWSRTQHDIKMKVVPVDNNELRYKCHAVTAAEEFTSTEPSLKEAIATAEQFMADIQESKHDNH